MENRAMIMFDIRRGEALATTMFLSPPKFILANASPYLDFMGWKIVCGGQGEAFPNLRYLLYAGIVGGNASPLQVNLLVCLRGQGRSIPQFKLSVICRNCLWGSGRSIPQFKLSVICRNCLGECFAPTQETQIYLTKLLTLWTTTISTNTATDLPL